MGSFPETVLEAAHQESMATTHQQPAAYTSLVEEPR